MQLSPRPGGRQCSRGQTRRCFTVALDSFCPRRRMGLCSEPMRRLTLLTLMSTLACTLAAGATVYRWVDENGVTHYSDQPHENAEKVHVAAPQTYSAPPAQNQNRPSSSASTGPAAAAPAVTSYQACSIISPVSAQNFPNTDSVPTVTQISPVPQGNDRAELFVDGVMQPNYPQSGGSYTLAAVTRGEHSLMLVVEDSGGRILCQSQNVTFSVTQPSILNPANPNARH